jgi:hypothetical protein
MYWLRKAASKVFFKNDLAAKSSAELLAYLSFSYRFSRKEFTVLQAACQNTCKRRMTEDACHSSISIVSPPATLPVWISIYYE